MHRKFDILLVDDDPELLASVHDILETMGYRVKACAGAEAALDAALSRDFAIGVIDYRLGSVKNGLDLIEELQIYHPNAKFVMITADVEKATQLRAAHLHLFDYLRKPIPPQTLISTVRRALAA
jgi:two-component system C4-dicarboxylate transport response regulator DctD